MAAARLKGDGSDSFRKLPDELIAKTLSGLSFKEAVRTSTLSRRWRNLWKSAELVLDFDPTDPFKSSWSLTPELAEKCQRYKDWVNGVLSQLQSYGPPRVIKFRVACGFNNNYNSEGDMDRWLEFAISNRVESLHLVYRRLIKEQSEMYVFSEKCYNHIKTPPGLLDIKPLRSLGLTYVSIRDEILNYLIANCPSLEELVLKKTGSLKNLRVVGSVHSPLPLKRLEVRTFYSLNSVEIDHAPHLAELVYRDWHQGLRVGNNCTSLVNVNLRVTHNHRSTVLDCFKGCASRLESMFLLIHALERPLYDVAEHTCLKRLTIAVSGIASDSLFGLIPLINECPHLHTLQVYVSVTDIRDIRKEFYVDEIDQESIRVVEIFGFSGYDLDREFVEYAMECFVGLERIVIELNRSIGDERLFDEDQFEEAEKLALAFKSNAPQTVEFIVK